MDNRYYRYENTEKNSTCKNSLLDKEPVVEKIDDYSNSGIRFLRQFLVIALALLFVVYLVFNYIETVDFDKPIKETPIYLAETIKYDSVFNIFEDIGGDHLNMI